MSDFKKPMPDDVSARISAASIALAGLGPSYGGYKAEGTRQERVLTLSDLTGLGRTRAETVYNDLCGTVQQTVCRERRTRAPEALDEAWAILRGALLHNGDLTIALALVDEWLALPYEDQRPSGSRFVSTWAVHHSRGKLTAAELRRILDE